MYIKYRNKLNDKLEFVHTLNGSGLATPRLMIALLETYQTKEGWVSIPDSIFEYFGKHWLRDHWKHQWQCSQLTPLFRNT